MLNLGSAKNRISKNSTSKNSNLANEHFGHLGWEVKLLKIAFLGPFLFIAVSGLSIGSKFEFGLTSNLEY